MTGYYASYIKFWHRVGWTQCLDFYKLASLRLLGFGALGKVEKPSNPPFRSSSTPAMRVTSRRPRALRQKIAFVRVAHGETMRLRDGLK
ncbi:MAG: hypothetical protein JWR26_2785 [Pedosphaera sp.]|nr:hypothetical protein [Pedosphaera sp.]